MSILFINSCPRKGESRTLLLAHKFLSAVQTEFPGQRIITQDLTELSLKSFDSQMLNFRETCCDKMNYTSPFFLPAVAFHDADLVVIAAPYWDLSFPSILKTWVEHIYVRNLNFHYENDQCIGTAHPKAVFYITTAGSYIGKSNFGAEYIKAVVKSLGVREFYELRAQGLDLEENDVNLCLSEAQSHIPELIEKLHAIKL